MKLTDEENKVAIQIFKCLVGLNLQAAKKILKYVHDAIHKYSVIQSPVGD